MSESTLVLRKPSEILQELKSLQQKARFDLLRGDQDFKKAIRVSWQIQGEGLVFSQFTSEGKRTLNASQDIFFESHLIDKKIRFQLLGLRRSLHALQCPFPQELWILQRRAGARYFTLNAFEVLLEIQDHIFPVLDVSQGGLKFEVYQASCLPLFRMSQQAKIHFVQESLSIQLEFRWKKKLTETLELHPSWPLTQFLLQQSHIQDPKNLQSLRISKVQIGAAFLFSNPEERARLESNLLQLFQKERPSETG